MSAGSDQNAELAALASTWTAGLARPVYLPMSRGELTGLLAAATDRLARAAAAEPADEAAARQQGGALVDADLVAPGVLPATVAALGRHLGGAARSLGGRRPDEGAAAVLAALTDGYLARLRTRILDEQESVRRAEVDARRQAEGALRSSEARFRAIFENAGIGIGIADMTGRIVDANSSFAGMLGYTVEEFRALRVSDFVYPDDAAGMWDLYREIIEGRRDRARVEKRYRHKDGRLVWTNLTASLIRDAAGAPLYTVAMVEDVTARRELQQRLRHQALHDPLTLLPNRTLVQERLAAAFARSGSRVGVCYLDLDLFKAVNDRLGHDIGDRLLVAVATRLHECVSTRGHLVARMGGDEFVILVEDPAPDELAILADVVLDVLQQPVRVDEHQLAVSASIGVVECDVDAMTPAEVLKAADVTLYWAKSDGRNRWARFDPDRNARDVARYTLSATLLPGLERDEFAVEYQPLVRLADGSVTGVEALVRWAHPTLGRLTPDQFIDLAEETGSIVPLGPPGADRGVRAGRRLEPGAPGRRPAGQRQPRRTAGARPGHRRRRHPGPGQDRAAAAPAAAGADRERAAGPGRAAAGRAARAGRDGHPDRRRRLRHRLLQPRLPRPAAAAHAEAGRLAGRGPRPARRAGHPGRADRGQPDRARAHPRPDRHGGGGGDEAAGRAAAGAGLRHRPGLALRPLRALGAGGRAAPGDPAGPASAAAQVRFPLPQVRRRTVDGMRWRGQTLRAVVGTALVVLASACGFGSGSGTELTVYSAQHEDLVKVMLDGFAKQTGIDVRLRSGSDFELGNQLVQEGDASPADVFLTENSPAMTLVASKGLFAPLDAGTLAQVPAQYASSGKDWVGFAARSTVLAYNPSLQPERDLPASIMDLAEPRWQGRPSGSPPPAPTSRRSSAPSSRCEGEAAARAWLRGLKANAKVYRSNVAVMAAVNSGEVRTGLMYHYYWYKDRAESGGNSANTELKFFGGKDAGAFVSVSGAGVLRSSGHPAQAQQLVAYLTSRGGQQALVASNALEYPVGTGIAANPKLKPLSELDPPTVDIGRLNGPRVVELMQQAGLL